MHALLKFISIISMLVVCTASYYGGVMLREQVADDIIQMTQNRSEALARGYVDTIWARYRDAMVALSLADPAAVNDSPVIKAFAAETYRYFSASSAIRANVYLRGRHMMMVDGQTGSRLVEARASIDPTFTQTHMRGEQAAHLLETTVPFQGDQIGTVLLTVYPIRSNQDAPDTAVEVFYDITAPLAKLDVIPYYLTSCVAGIFGMFLLIMLTVSKRNETLMGRLHEENVQLAADAATARAENQEKSKFLANISHELRTPLNAIIGFSDILKNEVIAPMNNQKYTNYIGDIHTSGVHLLSLINDILDYSKAEAGKLEVEVAEVNATKMILNSMRLVGPRAEAANVTLSETLPKEPMVMFIDGKKFKQVILNLLSNAVKFTPAGGEVSVSAWQNLSDDTYTFEVKDTGIGIAAKDISVALSPFGQIDSALSRKYEGTGLGLPLTKKFVELMGGHFAITSKVGIGTTITFTLPRLYQPDPVAAVAKKPTTPPSKEPAIPAKAAISIASMASGEKTPDISLDTATQ